MELSELNQQASIHMNGGPGHGRLNTNYNLNMTQQQILAANRLEHSMGPPMRSAGQNRYQTNNTNNTGANGYNISSNAPEANTKHRELPVDVPDSFVGMAKQSPRYPPPKLSRQISPPMALNYNPYNQNPATSSSSNQTTVYNQQNNANNRNVSTNGTSIKNTNHQQPTVPPIAQSAATNIMTHNSSLRSSIKLKQLEKSRNQQGNAYPGGHMQASINQGFELNEDDDGQPTDIINHNQGNNNYHKQEQQLPHVKQTSNQGMNDLCSLYSRLQNDLNGDFADVDVDGKLAKLLSIYNTIIKTHDKHFKIPSLASRYHVGAINNHGIQDPLIYKSSDLLYSVKQMFHNLDSTDDVGELMSILNKHEMDGVCSAFDRITQSFEFAKTSPPPSPPPDNTRLETNGFQENTNNHQHQQINNNSTIATMPVTQIHGQFNNEHDANYYLNNYPNYIGDNVRMDIEGNLVHDGMNQMSETNFSNGGCRKTIFIPKNSNQPLGVTIKNDSVYNVIVGRIVCGGVAHKSGELNEGDEILEVNGIPIQGQHIDDVVKIIDNLKGTLSMTIRTPKTPPRMKTQTEKMFVRTFFDFDGEKDIFNPCKELGLSFKKGEILSIIDQSDEIWWQAMREHDSDLSSAGLIPSLKFLNQREHHLSSHDHTVPNMKHEKRHFWTKLINCPKSGATPKRRKEFLNMTFGPDQNQYYEEVNLLYPYIRFPKRPIILVGHKLIGQREIQAKLLQDSNRFGKAISHTTKPKEAHERDGVDFHFVTRAQFESDIKAGKFIEYGTYQNQYYGTSLETMREVLKSKKICVHLVNYPSIFNFRNGRVGSELKPYFVFVKPDDHPDKLRNIVSAYSQPKSNIEEIIRAISEEVKLIEEHYLPYFDYILTVSNIDLAYQELLAEIDKIEREPQWIPMFWQDPSSS